MKLAVFGDPISHSRSPDIHAQFAKQADLQVDYQPIKAPLQSFPKRLEAFYLEGGQGANVTLPLKEKAMELCCALTTKAERAGAVNTLVRCENGWLGDNTDGDGLVKDLLRLNVDLQEKNIVLLGAGGASRGVIQPLLDMGVAHIFVLNRTEEKARQLAAFFNEMTLEEVPSEKVPSEKVLSEKVPPEETPSKEAQPDKDSQGNLPEHHMQTGSRVSGHALNFVPDPSVDLIINATSSGISKQAPAIALELLKAHPFCYDMMYGPGLMPFQSLAEGHKCRHANGLGMLVEQAALSFSRWTGYIPDTKPVLHSLQDLLKS